MPAGNLQLGKEDNVNYVSEQRPTVYSKTIRFEASYTFNSKTRIHKQEG